MPALSSILLIDDDETTNFLNKLLLTRMGATERVLLAENGEQGLRTLAEACHTPNNPACPRLIFLDMNMPVLNGLGFLEAYAQIPTGQRQHIVIVMLTTSLNPEDHARVERLPIAGFLTKPLTKEKVLTVLQEHFAQQE